MDTTESVSFFYLTKEAKPASETMFQSKCESAENVQEIHRSVGRVNYCWSSTAQLFSAPSPTVRKHRVVSSFLPPTEFNPHSCRHECQTTLLSTARLHKVKWKDRTNDDLQRIWKEAVVVPSRYYPCFCQEGLRKTILACVLIRDSNRESPEQKSRAIPLCKPAL
jgi:hypothetical protein